MNTQDFVYWLQGWMEIENPREIDARKTQIIKDHLALVFKKETPDRTFEPVVPMLDCSPEEAEIYYDKAVMTPSLTPGLTYCSSDRIEPSGSVEFPWPDFQGSC